MLYIRRQKIITVQTKQRPVHIVTHIKQFLQHLLPEQAVQAVLIEIMLKTMKSQAIGLLKIYSTLG